jgi:hypothetical protein
MAAGLLGLFVRGRCRLAACWLAALVVATASTAACAAEPPVAEDEDAEGADTGLYLPTDRQQERQLDRAGRLLKDGRWSDAATLLDELLGAERDSFFRQRAGRDAAERGTWASVKAEAARLIATLPPAGREAYQLQFRARAEKLLAEAVAADDTTAILAVARRWFATPAGQRAAVLAAVEALEANQPLSAAAWLERLESVAGRDEGVGTGSRGRFRRGDRHSRAGQVRVPGAGADRRPRGRGLVPAGTRPGVAAGTRRPAGATRGGCRVVAAPR